MSLPCGIDFRAEILSAAISRNTSNTSLADTAKDTIIYYEMLNDEPRTSGTHLRYSVLHRDGSVLDRASKLKSFQLADQFQIETDHSIAGNQAIYQCYLDAISEIPDVPLKSAQACAKEVAEAFMGTIENKGILIQEGETYPCSGWTRSKREGLRALSR